MGVNKEQYFELTKELQPKNAVLVAVSKTKPVEDIGELYGLGQRDFGENYVQELVEKQEELPADIRWHFIGHLQRNKVKYIAPFVHLIHSVDSFKLLKEINSQAQKAGRTIGVLLQVHIATEETKFGFAPEELDQLVKDLSSEKNENQLRHVQVKGLMGMASFTADPEQVRNEFKSLKLLFDRYASTIFPGFSMEILSTGMSADYRLALEEGSSMVRIGSLLFGER